MAAPIPQLSPSRPGNIRQFTIKGNDVTGLDSNSGSRVALVDIRYYENILSPTLHLSVGIKETDDLLDALPIRGGEECKIKIEDAEGNGLNPTLYVNKISGVIADPLESNYFLDLTSKESFKNDQSRVVKRYEGKISDNVKKILKESTSGSHGIKTSKEVDLDDTLTYNFIGNNKKPFHVCTWLAAKSVPVKAGKIGGAAGFLFYETQDGFNFKSIDALFKQKAKRKLIFTGTPDLPPDFDAKIINYSIDKNIDVKTNLALGAYANQTLFFDFFAYEYSKRDFSVGEGGKSGSKDKIVTGGKDNFYASADKELIDTPSRLMTRIKDVGALPSGRSAEKQLEAWRDRPDEPTFDAEKIMVQSLMRYNQLYAIKLNVLIPGDFTLKAGDLIECDFSKVSPSKNMGMDKRISGIYMIASVCHRLTSDHTTTNLTLVRDTFGKKSST